jgi:hypothetical protein
MRDHLPGLGATSGYVIRTQGHISDRWSDWFDGVTLEHQPDGTTLLRCPALDQAALHGLLAKVRDLGLPLISVTSIATPSDPDTTPDTTPRSSEA